MFSSQTLSQKSNFRKCKSYSSHSENVKIRSKSCFNGHYREKESKKFNAIICAIMEMMLTEDDYLYKNGRKILFRRGEMYASMAQIARRVNERKYENGFWVNHSCVARALKRAITVYGLFERKIIFGKTALRIARRKKKKKINYRDTSTYKNLLEIERKPKYRSSTERERVETLQMFFDEKGIHFTLCDLQQWARKYSDSYLYDHVYLLIERMETNKIQNLSKWMEIALKNNYHQENQKINNNKDFAQQQIQTLNLTSLSMKSWYCTDTYTGDQFMYNIPEATFKNLIENHRIKRE